MPLRLAAARDRQTSASKVDERTLVMWKGVNEKVQSRAVSFRSIYFQPEGGSRLPDGIFATHSLSLAHLWQFKNITYFALIARLKLGIGNDSRIPRAKSLQTHGHNQHIDRA